MNRCQECKHAVTSSRIPAGFIACALTEPWVYRPAQWACGFAPSRFGVRPS